MRTRKGILILMLILSLLFMVLIVYLIKNRLSIFGKDYLDYVNKKDAFYYSVIKTNIGQIDYEIKNLAQDNIVKSVYISATLGENTERYFDAFKNIKTAIQDCDKIQVVGADGRVIFSTETNEINSVKIVTFIMDDVQRYFSLNTNVFVFFINKDLFASFYPISAGNNNAVYNGYVMMQYKMNRLLKGIPSSQVRVAYAFTNTILLSTGSFDTNRVRSALVYLRDPEFYKNNSKGIRNIAIPRHSISGTIQGIDFTNDRYIPLNGIIILLINLVFFFVIVVGLIQVMKEERIIKEIPVKPVEVSIPESKYEEKAEEIKSLVTDIEGSKLYEEREAKEGIEKLILSDEVNLTEPFKEEVVSEEKEIEKEKPEIEISETVVGPEISTYESIKPSKTTDLFAEEERILEGIERKGHVVVESEASPDIWAEETGTILTESFSAPEEVEVSAADKILQEEEPISIDLEQIKEVVPSEKEELVEVEKPVVEEPVIVSDKAMESIETMEEEKQPEVMSEEKIEIADIEVPEIALPEEETGKKAERVESVEEEFPSIDLGEEAMLEPPIKTTSISTIEDYQDVALDLARNSMNMENVILLKKEKDRFITIKKNGFEATSYSLSEIDPIYTNYLSKNKAVNIVGNLDKSSYLKEHFSADELENLEELLIVPISRREHLEGVAVYARQKGKPEATHFQKLELMNLGYL